MLHSLKWWWIKGSSILIFLSLTGCGLSDNKALDLINKQEKNSTKIYDTSYYTSRNYDQKIVNFLHFLEQEKLIVKDRHDAYDPWTGCETDWYQIAPEGAKLIVNTGTSAIMHRYKHDKVSGEVSGISYKFPLVLTGIISRETEEKFARIKVGYKMIIPNDPVINKILLKLNELDTTTYNGIQKLANTIEERTFTFHKYNEGWKIE